MTWQPNQEEEAVFDDGERTNETVSINGLEALINVFDFLLNCLGVIGARANRATVTVKMVFL